MTFNPNIPQSGDLASASQPQILTNFSQLNTIFDIDHIAYDNATAANRGKHDKSTYLNQAGDPVTAATEAAVYAKLLAGFSELYMRRNTNGTVIQLSEESGDPVLAFGGQTFLPGGLILKWGNRTGVADGTTITFATDTSAFPNTCLQVFVSLYDPSNATVADSFVSVIPASVINTGFIVTCSKRISKTAQNASFAYLAIGY